MSFTYYLDLGAGAAPERLKHWMSSTSKREAPGPALAITMAAVDHDDAKLSRLHYGFVPVWRIALRQASGADTEDADQSLFRAIQDLLDQVSPDVALETQDPVTVLVRKGGRLVLNRGCDAARWAAPFFPQAVWADFPPL